MRFMASTKRHCGSDSTIWKIGGAKVRGRGSSRGNYRTCRTFDVAYLFVFRRIAFVV